MPFHNRKKETILADEVKRAVSTAKDKMTFAVQALDIQNYGKASGEFADARERRDAIENEPRFQGREKVTEFLAKCDRDAASFKERYATEALAKALKQATSLATDNLSHANTYFDSHRHGQALDYLAKAKSAAASVAGDERFYGLKSVDEFFEKVGSDITIFEIVCCANVWKGEFAEKCVCAECARS